MAKFWGIVPAAGSGRRMRQATPKQYLRVCGKTVLEHSLLALLSNDALSEVVVCLNEDDPYWPSLELARHSKIRSTVGGATRAQSVLHGLRALHGKAAQQDWVLVHDAARPCLSPASVVGLMAQLKGDNVGGLLAVPVKDTLKQAAPGSEPRITATLDRAQVWQAQTPQMFRYGLLASALADALQAGADITDEASALEWAGHSPRLIEGDAQNLKVTTPEDLALAEFLLSNKSSTIPADH